MGEIERAVADLSEMIRIDPDCTQAYWERGKLRIAWLRIGPFAAGSRKQEEGTHSEWYPPCNPGFLEG